MSSLGYENIMVDGLKSQAEVEINDKYGSPFIPKSSHSDHAIPFRNPLKLFPVHPLLLPRSVIQQDLLRFSQ